MGGGGGVGARKGRERGVVRKGKGGGIAGISIKTLAIMGCFFSQKKSGLSLSSF